MRSGGDNVGEFAGVRVEPGGDQSGEVRHVDHEHRSASIGGFAEFLEIDDAGVGAASGNDHLRLVFDRETQQLVVVDALVFLANVIGHYMVIAAREIVRIAVREVSAVVEVEAEDGVAGGENRAEHSGVRLRAGMRLNVRVFGVEELLRPVSGERFQDVSGVLAAAVVAFAGVAFGVLIGVNAGGRLHDGFGGEVLAGDQLNAGVLALDFLLDEVVDVRIYLDKRAGHFLLRGHCMFCLQQLNLKCSRYGWNRAN